MKLNKKDEEHILNFAQGVLSEEETNEVSSSLKEHKELQVEVKAYCQVLEAEQGIHNQRGALDPNFSRNVMTVIHCVEGRERHYSTLISAAALVDWYSSLKESIRWYALGLSSIPTIAALSVFFIALNIKFIFPYAPWQETGTGETIEVLVPKIAIQAGTPLTPIAFVLEKRLRSQVPFQPVSSYETLVGKYANASLDPGEALDINTLSPYVPLSVLPSIPSGFGIVKVKANLEGLKLLVSTGSKVDVMWYTEFSGEKILKPVAQSATVLTLEMNESAILENTPQMKEGYVVLLLSVSDATKVQLAELTGSLTLQLRASDDTVNQPEGVTTLSTILKPA